MCARAWVCACVGALLRAGAPSQAPTPPPTHTHTHTSHIPSHSTRHPQVKLANDAITLANKEAETLASAKLAAANGVKTAAEGLIANLTSMVSASRVSLAGGGRGRAPEG